MLLQHSEKNHGQVVAGGGYLLSFDDPRNSRHGITHLLISKKFSKWQHLIYKVNNFNLKLPWASDGRSADTAISRAAHAHDALVHGGLDAIVLLNVELGKVIVIVH